MEIREAVLWVLQGGGAGILFFLALSYWPAVKAWYEKLVATRKRDVAWIGTVIVAWVFFGFSILAEWSPRPMDWLDLVSSLFTVAFVAITANQKLHSWVHLADKDRRARYPPPTRHGGPRIP